MNSCNANTNIISDLSETLVIGGHHMHYGSLPQLRRNPMISHFTAPAPSKKIRRQLPCHWGLGGGVHHITTDGAGAQTQFATVAA